MIIIEFPDELQAAVFELIEEPKEAGAIILTLKIYKELDEIIINQLKSIGCKIIQPIK